MISFQFQKENRPMHWSVKANVDRAGETAGMRPKEEKFTDKEDSKPMILKHLKSHPYKESQAR